MNPLQDSLFGTLADGREARLFRLRNSAGTTLDLTNYGAILFRLFVAGRDGRMADVLLGFDTLEDYVAKNSPYMGAVCGRFANRIAAGRFSLGGRDFSLAVNNGPNHLHGGLRGFDKALWDVKAVEPDGRRGPRVVFRHVSPDGDEGYPGEMTVTVAYTLTAENEVVIEYEAATDRPTILNLTNHAYFNLAGHDSGTCLDQSMQLMASRYTPCDATSIPTGRIEPVDGTPLDFRTPVALGARIRDPHPEIRRGQGYDQNFVLDHGGGTPALSAVAVDPVSGRQVELFTTEPGVQLYTAGFLDGSVRGKGGTAYPQWAGFCLETQHFPDSPNKPAFPSVALNPGETYRQKTIYRFGVKRA